MREIEFRGKRMSGHGWVYGDICHHDENISYIGQHPANGDMLVYDLIVETISQYTGFRDIYKNKIYEGDILSLDGFWSVRVEYENGSFMIRDLDKVRYNNLICNSHIGHFNISEWKIVGNIYDNPELLEGEI